MLAAILATVALAAPGGCQEDQACFTWSTMGNLERGVYLKHQARRVIVEPCEFAYLDYKARIDWRRTPRLRGDEYARRHGCDWRLYAPDAGN